MGNNDSRWNYVFVCSNRPAPRSIEKCQAVIQTGKRLVLVYIDRPGNQLKLTEISKCDVRRFSVSFRQVELRRLYDMFLFYRWLKKNIFSYATRDCDVYIDALDLLFIVTLIGKGNHTFRYEVRDLNSKQIERSLISLFIKNIERFLLMRVDRLILTSYEFYLQYYKDIYKKKYAIVENYPNIGFWNDFTRINRNNEFVIGYVGVIRYLKCIGTLVEAVKILRDKKCSIVLKFAGSGAVDELKKFAGTPPWIEYIGPYNNSSIKDIYKDVDLSFAVYDPAVKNVRYAIPNKFYEAILTGIPILVAKGTFLEKRVKELGIGTSTDPYNANLMADIIFEAYNNDGWFVNALDAFKKLHRMKQFQYDELVTEAVVG